MIRAENKLNKKKKYQWICVHPLTHAASRHVRVYTESVSMQKASHGCHGNLSFYKYASFTNFFILTGKTELTEKCRCQQQRQHNTVSAVSPLYTPGTFHSRKRCLLLLTQHSSSKFGAVMSQESLGQESKDRT